MASREVAAEGEDAVPKQAMHGDRDFGTSRRARSRGQREANKRRSTSVCTKEDGSLPAKTRRISVPRDITPDGPPATHSCPSHAFFFFYRSRLNNAYFNLLHNVTIRHQLPFSVLSSRKNTTTYNIPVDRARVWTELVSLRNKLINSSVVQASFPQRTSQHLELDAEEESLCVSRAKELASRSLVRTDSNARGELPRHPCQWRCGNGLKWTWGEA